MSYDALFTQALAYFDNGRFDEAEQLLRRIAETAPEQPDVLNLLGLTAQAKGLHAEAVSYFAAAIREKNTEPAFYYNMAFSLKALGQYPEALVNFKKVLQMAPQVKEAHNETACIYEILNKLDEAREQWQAALKLDGGYLSAAVNLANSYRFDDKPKAENDLKRIADNHPEEASVWYNLAWLAYQKQDFEQASAYVRKAGNLLVSDDINYLAGIICLAMGQTNEAERYFATAEELNPDHFAAKLRLADILSKKGYFADAEIRYKRLAELEPDDFDTHQNYGEMLYRQHRLSEALEEYRKAVIISPSSAEVNNNLGIVLKDLGDYQQALGLFFNALSLNRNLEAVSVNIAETLVLLAATDEENARKIAENWQKSYPDNPFAKHLNAALLGDDIGNNQIYTEKLFDNFADNYEMVMQNLDYSAPLAVGRIAGPVEGRVVDLGCGSGLIGMAVKTGRNQIIGVDLSGAMLKKAADKGVYTELVKSDILDFLRQRNDFDYITAGDVLGYIGALDEFIKLCRNKKIIFTIEVLDGEENYKIYPNGRFKHSPAYVEKLLRKNGFCDIYKEEIILRTENGIPVKGCVFKAAGESENGR